MLSSPVPHEVPCLKGICKRCACICGRDGSLHLHEHDHSSCVLTSLADNESIPEFEAFRDPDGLRHLQPFPLISTQLQHPFSPQMHSSQTLLERVVQVPCARNLLWLLHLLYRGDEEIRNFGDQFGAIIEF